MTVKYDVAKEKEISDYIEKAAKKIIFTKEDGHYMSEVRGILGLFALAKSKEESVKKYKEILRPWIYKRLNSRLELPKI